MKTLLITTASISLSLFFISSLYVRINDLYKYRESKGQPKGVSWIVPVVFLVIAIALFVAAKEVE